MTGIRFPSDLGAWYRWQGSRHRLRNWMTRTRRHEPPPGTLWLPNHEPKCLVVCESGSGTSRLALLTPGEIAESALLLPDGMAAGATWTKAASSDLEQLTSVQRVLSAGHYLPLGARVDSWARERGIERLVVQHGLLTPWQPPLPEEAHLLAWSDADAAFWASGRTDITTTVVGSELAWQAAAHPATPAEPDSLLWLGQLHGAELNRAHYATVAARFCRRHDATYRPHPAERDRLSRIIHDGFQRLGITVDTEMTPLHQCRARVVAAFSTGVYETAIRGGDAWVHYDHPPAWLREFWERYGMSRYGIDPEPTPRPEAPAEQPARAIARLLTS